MISEHPRGEDGAAAGGPRPVNAAIVLEPTGALHAMIADAKSWVRRELGDRVYLGEPPHSTLFAGTFDDVGTLGPLLEAVCSDAPPVTIRTIGMMTFPKDVRAGGEIPWF